MRLYRVRDWADHFENNRTRELRSLSWVPVPNRHDGDGYRTLIERKDGLALFGAWVLILEVASKCNPRGVLVRDSGQPHTAKSIGRMVGATEHAIQTAIDSYFDHERIESALKAAKGMEVISGKSIEIDVNAADKKVVKK